MLNQLPILKSPTKRQRTRSPVKFDAALHLPMANGLAMLGYLDVEIAEYIGVSNGTFYNWKRVHLEFLEAIARGRVPVDIEITKALRFSAVGGYVTEQKAFKVRDANSVESVVFVDVTRYVEGDPRAQIFWLKNRQRAHWKDYKQVEASGLDGTSIQHEVTSAGVEAALHKLIGIFGVKT